MPQISPVGTDNGFLREINGTVLDEPWTLESPYQRRGYESGGAGGWSNALPPLCPAGALRAGQSESQKPHSGSASRTPLHSTPNGCDRRISGRGGFIPRSAPCSLQQSQEIPPASRSHLVLIPLTIARPFYAPPPTAAPGRSRAPRRVPYIAFRQLILLPHANTLPPRLHKSQLSILRRQPWRKGLCESPSFGTDGPSDELMARER